MTLLTADLHDRIGETVAYVASEPLGRAAIRYFAEAVGDSNPLSNDLDAARAAGYTDLVAPPTLVCETNQYASLPMDEDGYAGHTWGFEVPGTRQIRGGNQYRFHTPVVATDVITATWTISAIDERTSRTGASMLIVRSSARYTNQDGELLAENDETIIFQEIA
ncbi:MAG: FAS1-like dehydratase domain-containing protein [Acidimicrobiia bacterium]